MLVETHMASSSMSVWWFSCASLGLWTVHSLRSIKGGGKRDSNLPGMTWMEHNNLEVDGRCELLMNPGHGWILPSAKDGWKIRWFFFPKCKYGCVFLIFFFSGSFAGTICRGEMCFRCFASCSMNYLYITSLISSSAGILPQLITSWGRMLQVCRLNQVLESSEYTNQMDHVMRVWNQNLCTKVSNFVTVSFNPSTS